MANPNYISGLNTTNQIRDNTDAIHSGVIKALNSMTSGNMIVEGCDVTQTLSGSTTQFDVASGKYMLDGLLNTFGGTSVSLNVTTQIPNATLNYDYYLLLVIDSGGNLAIRGDNTLVNALTPAVASLTSGDVVICVIQILGASGNADSRSIQYLTVDKASNTVSIAYDNGGTYTHTASIKGGVSGTNFQQVAGVALTVNDDAIDSDFIVKGDTDNTLLVANAGEDAVGIGKDISVGTGSSYKLQISGQTQSDTYSGEGIVLEYGVGASGTTQGDGSLIIRRNSASGKGKIQFATTSAGSTSYSTSDDVEITYDINKNWVFDASDAFGTKMQVTGILQTSGDIICGDELTVTGNIIRDSGGSNTITFDGSNNTTIVGTGIIGGTLQANSNATISTTLSVGSTATINGEFKPTLSMYHTVPTQLVGGAAPGTPISSTEMIQILSSDPSGLSDFELPDANAFAGIMIYIVNLSNINMTLNGFAGQFILDATSPVLLTSYNMAPNDGIRIVAITDGMTIPIAPPHQESQVGPGWIVLTK